PLQEISAEILRKIGRISDFDSNPS
ncbi:MAG: hypothetical protein RL173_3050, partial [Fibrobacterota bacterium]